MAKNHRPRVYVDASYDDGRAGLAITGALGLHTRLVPAHSSVHAETLALDWAFEMALSQKVSSMEIRTDCHGAMAKSKFMKPNGYDYNVVWVPRSKNTEANFHAKAAFRKVRYPVIWADHPLSGYTWPC